MAREPAASSALVVLLVSACAAAQTGVAARIAEPTPASRAELAQAVSAALNGAPVTLADDALTRDSLLVVEKRLTGRDLGRPERFRLYKLGKDCLLVHESTGERTRLSSAACEPVVP